MTTRRAAAMLAASLAAAALAVGARAQPPVALPVEKSWRTLETAHFRIHFRPPAEAFARAVTARVEAARTEVARLVGTFPERKVDVVIGEPEAVASARGLPFQEGPRILLHATPPTSAELEDFDDWIAVSLGYELAHIAHLARPPDNRALSFLSRTLPIRSLVLRLPDWLPAAYAASIADRLRSGGAPRRPFDSAVVRQLAAHRWLPALGELGGRAAWPPVRLQEAVGGAFLTWLDARPRGSLPEVWRRMTASAPRSLESAVAATSGEPLGRLSVKWRAEVEAQAAARTIRLEAAAPGIAIDVIGP